MTAALAPRPPTAKMRDIENELDDLPRSLLPAEGKNKKIPETNLMIWRSRFQPGAM